MLASLGPLLDNGLASGVYPVLLGSLLLLAVLLLAVWCWRLGRCYTALARISTLDPLTGLPNGRYFESERWPAVLRSTAPIAVLFIDLDHLKSHNARFGRRAGDRYIAGAASVLRHACRRGVDEVFRLYTAGDEFVVLLHVGGINQVHAITDNVLAGFRDAGMSASIGAAWTNGTRYQARYVLLDRAEEAMRQAKEAGKGRAVVVAVPASDQTAGGETAVPQALDESPQPPRHILGPSRPPRDDAR